jgi:hypothetical protein
LKRSTDRRWSLAEIRQNQKEHYAGMAEHPPDRKASADFHRPAYPNYTVEDALKKWGSRYEEGSGCRWSDWKKIM